jgi:hypothetical protein
LGDINQVGAIDQRAERLEQDIACQSSYRYFVESGNAVSLLFCSRLT